MKKLYILTGPSGAGASTAKYVFEELGYYIFENIPPEIVDDLFQKTLLNSDYSKVCLIVPILYAKKVLDIVERYNEFSSSLIILGCDKEILFQRYILSRHVHPRTIHRNISLEKAVDEDLQEVKKLMPRADIFIDTTKQTIKEFRADLYGKLIENKKGVITTIKFVSFGMKHGIQKDVDMIVDCRNLPNPFWEENLRELTGLDPKIIKYMNSFKETKQFLKSTIEYLDYHLAETMKAGRGYYTVGVACSGGRHRSTFIADYLCKHYSKTYKTAVYHRDCPELNKD